MIENFLNIRYSLRNLPDDKFEQDVAVLAKELESVSFYTNYDELELRNDWHDLKGCATEETDMSSIQRVGLKLCEHFFPNFYEIENNKGQSFKSMWNAEVLEKVLRWNRKSHSTPYMSEIKRGIYFTTGMTKSTMYRPQMAKTVVTQLNAKRVLDPCMGWGGRLLGSVASGVDMYIGFEPNVETFNNLTKMVKFLGEDVPSKVTLINDSALNMSKYDIEKVDIILTSPPYFDLEIYSQEDTQSIVGCSTYEEWVDKFLKPLIENCIYLLKDNGWSCWNVHNIGKMKMIDDVKNIHKDFNTTKVFSVTSSKRQSNQTKNDKKNSDVTICYSNTEIKNGPNFW